MNDLISHELFNSICRCKKLEKLFINQNGISLESVISGIASIISNCTNLKYIGIKQNTMTSDEYKNIIKNYMDNNIVFTSSPDSLDADYSTDILEIDDYKPKEEMNEIEEETEKKMKIVIDFSCDKEPTDEELQEEFESFTTPALYTQK